MTHYTRHVFLGLLLGLGGLATAQTLIETSVATSMQGTLQSVGTPNLLGARQAAQNAAAQIQAHNAAIAAAQAEATTRAAAVVTTPLTADQQSRLAQGQEAFRAGNYALARQTFETLVAQNFSSPEPHFALALTLMALKDDKGAAFELTQFADLAPDRYEGPYNLGVLATRRGDHQTALALYTQAAALMTGKAPVSAQRQVLEALAAAQIRAQDFGGLTITLTRVTALEPGDLNAQFRLAQAQTLAGQGTLALPGVYALLQKEPSRLDAALLLADIYVAQGLPDRAVRELDAAVSRVGTGAERATLHLRKAGLLAASGDTRAAIFAAEDAIREDSRQAVAYARVGEWRALRGDRPGALTAYLNAVKLEPKNAAYRTGLAAIRLSLGDATQASADAAQALRLRPDATTLARALFVQGVAAYQQKNYAQASAALQASLTRNPTADTALWLGLSAYARQDYAAAATALAESVRLQPSAAARGNLASALLAGARYAEAEAVARGLVADEPKNAHAWYLLGLAQRAQAREKDATLSLKTAAGLGSVQAQGALR